MLIETPPRGPRGRIFEIYQQAISAAPQTQTETIEGRFKVFHVTAQDAVREGLITQEFLDEEKFRLGALYPQYYAAEGEDSKIDWFNKYVVTRVDLYDNTGGFEHQQTFSRGAPSVRWTASVTSLYIAAFCSSLRPATSVI